MNKKILYFTTMAFYFLVVMGMLDRFSEPGGVVGSLMIYVHSVYIVYCYVFKIDMCIIVGFHFLEVNNEEHRLIRRVTALLFSLPIVFIFIL